MLLCIYLLTYWSFPLRFPLIVGWSAFCCVTGLMAFLHLDLSLASAIINFLYELLHEHPNDLRLRILENCEIIRKY